MSGALFEAGAKPRVLKARLGSLDDVARGLIGLLGGFRRLAFRMKLSDCHVGLPELGRIAQGLGEAQRRAEVGLRLLPAPSGLGDLAAQPPAERQVLPARLRVASSRHSFANSLARVASPGRARARRGSEHVGRVAPPHPLARARVADDPVHLLQELARRRGRPGAAGCRPGSAWRWRPSPGRRAGGRLEAARVVLVGEPGVAALEMQPAEGVHDRGVDLRADLGRPEPPAGSGAPRRSGRPVIEREGVQPPPEEQGELGSPRP